MEGTIRMDEKFSEQGSQESVKDEFGNKIGRLTKSKAYLDFCEEVYGYRMYLFNMMDKEQLDFVFNSVPLSSGDTVLDLGCGPGSVLNLLTEKYGCLGVGIDRLNNDIVKIRNRSGVYINGDIDRIPEYRLKPAVTLSIDSLYFSNSPEALLRHLCGISNNRMYLFYSEYLFEETPAGRETLRGSETKVAGILNKIRIPYETVEYSKNERSLYEKSLLALKKREEEFRNEGNYDLYENKLNEDRLGKCLYDNGLASRYLYIIKNT